jgi:hypothetical protein
MAFAKAKAEVGVQVVQRWVLAVLRKRQFFSLADLNEAIFDLAGVSHGLREKGFNQQKRKEIVSPWCIYHDALFRRRYSVEGFGQLGECWIHLFDLHVHPRPSSAAS